MREDLLQMIREFPGNAGVILGDPENPGFCYQEDQKFPSASVIKLFILWELYRQTENGEKSLTDQIVLTEEMKVGGFGVLTHLTGNPSLSLHDIATLMIISSDNTATNILIDSLGIAQINATCKKMGWNETILGRKMMDFEAKAAGKDNYTSPRAQRKPSSAVSACTHRGVKVSIALLLFMLPQKLATGQSLQTLSPEPVPAGFYHIYRSYAGWRRAPAAA